MNDDTTPKGLGYDPCDRKSFPYQANDPPFSANDLVLDPLTLEMAPDLVPRDMVAALLEAFDEEPTEGFRTLDMGLRLFNRLANDPVMREIDLPQLWAASIHTAIIWEFG